MAQSNFALISHNITVREAYRFPTLLRYRVHAIKVWERRKSAAEKMEIKVQAFESLDSTNDHLKKLASEGAPEGTVVIADAQTAGRGRMGRSFASAPGCGIYMSMLLRPEGCSADCAASLTAVAAVAVCRAIEKTCGRSAGIKWVNDLYMRGKKICGILCESSVAGGRVDYAVLGIGLNVTTRLEDFPEELRDTAGSLYTQTGFVFERGKLIAAIIAELSSLYSLWLEGPGVCHAEYKRRCIVLDRQITVSSPEGEYDAVAENISADYGLVLRLPDGGRKTVHSGEVKIKI